MKRWTTALTLLLSVVSPALVLAHPTTRDERLSRIGPAPDFALTNQDGKRITLSELRGRVVAVTFIYASCADACSLLTAKMVRLQARLGRDFGPKVFFVSITVDPERDTPAVLRNYAMAHGANTAGWAFVLGRAEEIRAVARGYGIYYKKSPRGDVDHSFLTSVVDRHGILRVQYPGVRFDPDELLQDIKGLLREEARR